MQGRQEDVWEGVSERRKQEWLFCLEVLSADPQKEKALSFLLCNMPKTDLASLPVTIVMDSIDMAFRARNEFAWCRNLSEEMFFNYVLPYAVFDEERDDWRQMIYPLASSIVHDKANVCDAVIAINERIFDLVGVKYSTER
jgi:hypothetical protein